MKKPPSSWQRFSIEENDPAAIHNGECIMRQVLSALCFFLFTMTAVSAAEPDAGLKEPPTGFVALFNGKDLTGWSLANKPGDFWKAENGLLVNNGKGPHLVTEKSYKNFELWMDWKISTAGDSGVFLPGGQQVQIWAKKEGSGGFVFDHKYSVAPAVVADRPLNEWNSFYIKLQDGKVTVKLNDKVVMDAVPVEKGFVPPKQGPTEGPISIQRSPHSVVTSLRNVFVRDLDAK